MRTLIAHASSLIACSVVLPAAYFGPKIVAWMRERGLRNALCDLAATVSESDFVRVFGVDKSALDVLIQVQSCIHAHVCIVLADCCPVNCRPRR